MADKTINDLAAAAALTGTEKVPVWQGGTTKETSTQDIADLATPDLSPYLKTDGTTAGAVDQVQNFTNGIQAVNGANATYLDAVTITLNGTGGSTELLKSGINTTDGAETSSVASNGTAAFSVRTTTPMVAPTAGNAIKLSNNGGGSGVTVDDDGNITLTAQDISTAKVTIDSRDTLILVAPAGLTMNGNAGFSGTGAFTNFTIENGIITAAS